MRTRTLLLARVSIMGVLAAVLGSCAPRVIDRTLAERPVYVDIPHGVATPAQKAQYVNNPVAVERYERRCTEKPVTGAVCISSVELKITVFEGAQHVRVGGHQGKALLLAWIENLGSRATFDGIQAGEQALVAVDKSDPGQPRQTALRMIHFRRNLIPPNFTVTDSEYAIVKTCHPGYRARASDMSFRGCIKGSAMEQGHSPTGVLSTSRVSRGAPHPFWKRTHVKSDEEPADFLSLDDPLWFRCSPGCCTS